MTSDNRSLDALLQSKISDELPRRDLEDPLKFSGDDTAILRNRQTKTQVNSFETLDESEIVKTSKNAIAPTEKLTETPESQSSAFQELEALEKETLPIPQPEINSDRVLISPKNDSKQKIDTDTDIDPIDPPNAPTGKLWSEPEPRDRPGLIQREEYIPDQIIVKFKPGLQALDVNAIQATVNAATVAKTQTLGSQLWKVNGVSLEEAIAKLEQDPRIEYVEPNYKVSLVGTPNDPSFNQLWGLNNTGQTGGTTDADIDATEAWDIATGSSDIVVGVIDTGVDYNHPDLADNIWTNQTEAAGSFGVDDDGNGYVDDIHGYDFVNNDGDPLDDNGHGSHVSGTIAGVGDNGIGVTGVNWDAQIMGLKFLDAEGYGSIFAATQAVEYATQMGAKLTNNSWGGGGYSQALYDAIAAAGDAEQLFVAAAGNYSSDNDTFLEYPSSYDLNNIVAVAATDHNDNLAYFSNYGATTVDLGAPGDGILSTVPYGNGYDTYSGTSMATPHVAGVASLLWSQDPSRSADQVKSRLLASVDPIVALEGKTLTGGRLNAFRALAEAGKGSIRGTKWNDLDVDGVRDANEPGLPDWTIFLDQNNNGILDQEFTTFNATTAPVPITDLGTITSQLDVSGLSGFTADVNVTLDISHTWDDDLDVFLVSPTGKKVELFSDVGADGDNFTNTTLDDEAVTSIAEGTAPFSGTYKPEAELAGFMGEDPNGTWTLEVTDDAKQDSGILNSWSLTFTSSEPIAKTDQNGEYAFNGLEPGTYTVAEELQPGWEQTYPSGDGTHTVNVEADEILEEIDFGNRNADIGVIKGKKWHDKDGNGIQDPGDTGLKDWTIYLDENDNGQLDAGENSTKTDENGDYSFFDLEPGTYTVAEVLQTGWVQTFPTAPGTHSVTLEPGEIEGNLDFGNQALPGEIQGSKWSDTDGDGVWDEGEQALAGWTIYLDDNENGQLDVGEVSTVTDANGSYLFSDLQPGTYHVAEVQQEGWKQTYPGSAKIFGDPEGDTFGFDLPQLDIKNVSGKVTGNSLILAMDFFSAIAAPSTGSPQAVGGYWDLDLDQNPLTGTASYQSSFAPPNQQGGPLGDEVFIDLFSEQSQPGFVNLIETNTYTIIGSAPITYSSDSIEIQVPLSVLGDDGDLNYGTVIGTALEPTDAAPNTEYGTIGESNLAGDAQVAVTPKDALPSASFAIAPAWGKISKHSTKNVTTSSQLPIKAADTSEALPGYHTIQLDPGGSETNINFGNQEIIPGEISGYKWNDIDGDAAWDENESGLEGWTIYLDANDNGQLDDSEVSTTTDANGYYAFTNLDAGSYTVAEVPVDGWQQTYPHIGVQQIFDADFNYYGSDEPTLDGFSIDNTGGEVEGLWHLSTGRGNQPGHSADDSLYFGQGEGAEGGGNYDVGWTAGRVTSPDIQINTIGDLELSFNYFLQTEGLPASYDQARVLISENGGAFQPIASNANQLLDPTTGWTNATFDLSQYVGSTIEIQFDFNTVDASVNGYEGWYIDDIVLRQQGDGTHKVDLQNGEIKTDLNFGNQQLQPGEIQGSKWNDADGDGVWDDGEQGLAGWTIYLDDNKNGQLDDGEESTVTDADGNYSFQGLDAGTYTVAEVPQDGWVQTYPGESGDDTDQVLIFMDKLPWGSDALIDELNANGVNPTVATSAQMDGINLSSYDVVFISNDQPQAFYTNYNANAAKFADYVQEGGTFWVGAASLGSNGGDFGGGQLPNGVTVANAFEDYNNVLEVTHPLMSGVPNPFFGTSASHAGFNNLPVNATAIAKGQFSNLPTLIEYEYGAGEVLAFGQTLEYGYEYTQDAGKILQNGIPYVLELADDPLPGTHEVEVGSGEILEGINFGNQQVAVPQLSIDDVTVTEGNSGTTNAVFTVSLSAASSQTVTVDYATNDGSAIAPEDYTATTGTLTFAPGETSQQIEVPIIGDTTDEVDESFSVNLTNANNAEITDAQGTATILDDDTLGGSPTHDLIIGTSSHDTLSGGAGNDTLDGLDGHDWLDGGADHDELKGGKGFDSLYGGSGYDILDGGADHDWLEGGADHDVLKGGAGKDSLIGGTHDDDLNGGAGEDVLMGVDPAAVFPGRGELDTLTGGAGSDRYILGDLGRGAYYNDGNTSNGGILDFALLKTFNSSEDVIQLAGSAAEYELSVVGSNTNIYLDDDGVAGLSSQDELIGRVVGVTGLALTDSYFVYS